LSRCRTLVAGLAVGFAALPAASADAKSMPFGERSLRPGMRGHDVRVLQDFLTRVGVSTPVDGQYGPYTKRRVKTWERRSKRRVDGRVARPDARVLRRQVESGKTVLAPRSTDSPDTAFAAEVATLGSDGKATAPASAPPEVKAVIDAANRIAGKPYKYGGGHGKWEDSGYDCSGSESYALHGGGFVDSALTSSDFESWGVAGKGAWITSYANSGHSFLVVAGLRFDTGWNNSGKGPRWSEQMRPSDGYVVRHPEGF
jgi:peptidoglycan hydrolase-like protein with peptidoglycan-binding domain